MREQLLNPVETILYSAEALLMETEFDDLQRKFIQSIHSDACGFYELIVSIPDLSWSRAKEVLSFESRSHLASIIGYTEMLLDETDMALDSMERQYLQAIRASGKQLLHRLARL